MSGPAEEISYLKIVGNTKALARRMREAKGAAIAEGLRDSIAVTTAMFRHLRGEERSFATDDQRLNEATVLWMLCNRVAGNSREKPAGEDDARQGRFDFGDYPLRRYGPLEAKFDGRRVVFRDPDWVIVAEDGEETKADKRDAPLYEALASRPYVATDIVPVREFSVEDGDQRLVQMLENRDHVQGGVVIYEAGWRLIRPVMIANPDWNLGMAVDDLRDRGEWPDELDG